MSDRLARSVRGGGLRGAITGALALALLLLGATGAVAKPGDLLVSDNQAGPGSAGSLFRLDPGTGVFTTVRQGSPFDGPGGLDFGPDGQLYLANNFSPAVFRIDPVSGSPTPLASGSPLVFPFDVAYAPDGELYVTDVGFGPAVCGGFGCGALFRLDPAGGTPTPVASGPPFNNPTGVAISSTGTIYVSESNLGAPGTIFNVDPATGARTPVAQGPPLADPMGMQLTPDGQLYVADSDGPGGTGALHRVDLRTGVVTTIAQGPPFDDPFDVAVTPDNRIFVTDLNAKQGLTFLVDPATGNRTPVGTASGFVTPHSVAVEPPLCKGKPATIVGSVGADTLTGSAFADVIAGLEGKDRVNAGKGKDLVCGGTGKDRISGGAGKDRLFGEGGKDKLTGGKGKDKCVGGGGRDVAKACEAGKP